MSTPTTYLMTHGSPEAAALGALPWHNHLVAFGNWAMLVVDARRLARLTLMGPHPMEKDQGGAKYPVGTEYLGVTVDLIADQGVVLSNSFLFAHYILPVAAQHRPRMILGRDQRKKQAPSDPVVRWYSRDGKEMNPEVFLGDFCDAIRSYLGILRFTALPAESQPSPGAQPPPREVPPDPGTAIYRNLNPVQSLPHEETDALDHELTEHDLFIVIPDDVQEI